MGNTVEGEQLPFTEQEIQFLEKRFRKMDADGSGELEPNEFFDVPELA